MRSRSIAACICLGISGLLGEGCQNAELVPEQFDPGWELPAPAGPCWSTRSKFAVTKTTGKQCTGPIVLENGAGYWIANVTP